MMKFLYPSMSTLFSVLMFIENVITLQHGGCYGWNWVSKFQLVYILFYGDLEFV
jgi:hypothetical protein